MLGNGDGTLKPPIITSCSPEGPTGALRGDLDGDGRADLVVAGAGADRGALVLLGNGDGTFRKRPGLRWRHLPRGP